jgi:hypothetical protein
VWHADGIRASRVTLPEKLTPSAPEFSELSDFGVHQLRNLSQNGSMAAVNLNPENIFKYENGARYEIQFSNEGGAGRTLFGVEREKSGAFCLKSTKSIIPQAYAGATEYFD